MGSPELLPAMTTDELQGLMDSLNDMLDNKKLIKKISDDVMEDAKQSINAIFDEMTKTSDLVDRTVD